MNSFDFRDIVNRILDGEKIDLTAIASKASADRSYLSKVINSEVEKNIGKKMVGKLSRAFPAYFPENNENNTKKGAKASPADVDALSPQQILSILARANDRYSETLAIQARILERIESKMAQETTQATIKEAVAKIDTSSTEILAGVRSMSRRQKSFLAESKPRKSHRLPGSSKSRRQNDGAGEKPDRKK